MTGLTAVVTGASAGIGLQTALQLCAREDYQTVVFAVRNREKALSAIPPEALSKAVVMVVDLAQLSSVEKFAEELKKMAPIDRLVLNAGIAEYTNRAAPITVDGMDEIWQVNFVSHFYLTLLARPLLAPGARIVCLSSFMHWFGNASRFVDLVRKPSNPRAYMSYYADSKLAMAVFASELNRRNFGLAVAVNPGAVFSDIFRSWFFGLIGTIMRFLFNLLFLTTRDGARTSVLACTSGKMSGFTYLSPYGQVKGWGWLVACITDCYWFRIASREEQMVGQCSSAVDRKATGTMLWTLALEAIGETDPKRKAALAKL